VSAATLTAVSASISTPVGPVHRTVARSRKPPRAGSTVTSTCDSASGWQSGIRSAVRFAAWMPAMRATSSGLPFFAAPDATSRRAAADTRMNASAVASRTVGGFSPTSTIRTAPAASTCVSVRGRRGMAPSLAGRLFDAFPRQEERQALERLREIDALQLHVGRHRQRSGGEIQDRADAGADDLVDDLLRRRRRHGDDGDADPLGPDDLLELPDVVDGHAAARDVADLLVQHVEERDDLEAFLPEPLVVRQGEAQVSGAHD